MSTLSRRFQQEFAIILKYTGRRGQRGRRGVKCFILLAVITL